MNPQSKIMRDIAEQLIDALENNTLKTIGQAIEAIAEGLVEDADNLEELEVHTCG